MKEIVEEMKFVLSDWDDYYEESSTATYSPESIKHIQIKGKANEKNIILNELDVMHKFATTDEEPDEDSIIAQIVTEWETKGIKAFLTKIAAVAEIEL